MTVQVFLFPAHALFKRSTHFVLTLPPTSQGAICLQPSQPSQLLVCCMLPGMLQMR